MSTVDSPRKELLEEMASLRLRLKKAEEALAAIERGEESDESDRKGTEASPLESGNLYRALGESIDYGVWVCAPDGRNLYASDSFLRLVGLTQEECSDFGWGDVLHPDDAERTLTAWKECVRIGGVWDMEHRFRGVDGEWHPVLARGAPVRDESGEVVCWAGINLDISRMKRAEEAVRESEGRYRLLSETMLQGVVHQDAEGTIIAMNPAAERILGKTREEFIGSSSVRAEHDTVRENGDPFPGLEHPSMVALRTGQPVRGVVMGVLNPRLAEYRWIKIDAVPVFRRNETAPSEVYAVFEDITDQRRTEEAVRSNEERLRLALDAAHLATWDWHIPSGAIIWNSQHYRLLGYEPGSFTPTYRHWADRVHPDDLPATEERIRRAMEEGTEYRAEFRVILPDGPVRTLESLGRFERDATGSAVRLYGAMSDVTEQKEMMDALRRSKEELELRVAERTRELRESERKYRIVFDNEIFAIIIFDPETGTILDVNDAHVAMYGYSREELLSGVNAYDLSAEPGTSTSSVKGIVEQGARFVPLRLHRKKDGTVFPVEIVGGSYVWKGKQVMFGMTHDISERKLAEETFQNLNAYNRTLIEASIDPLVTIDAEGKISDVNSATEQVTGYHRQELVGSDFSDYFTEPDRAREGYRHVFKEGLVRDYPLEIRRRDGHRTPVLYNATVFHDRSGKIRGVFAAARDITKLKQAEAEREQFHKFFLTSSDVMVMADPNGAFVKTNPACTELLGYSAAELESRPFIDFIHPDDRQRTLDELARQQEIGYSIAFENRYLCKDGSYRWLSWRAVYNSGENIAYATGRDITLNKEQEEKLRKSELEFRMLAESMPQIVWITDPVGKNVYFNQQWVDYTGLSLEESYGDGWNKPFHPDDRQIAWDAWQRATKCRDRYSLESRLRRADGVYKWWLVRGVPFCDENDTVLKWFGTCTDIDDVKRAEEERLMFEQRMLQTQKLESLGILAGGIAHDFNNILMAIIGNASLALTKLDPESPVAANLRQIEQSSERAADLAKQMLAYSGRGKFQIEQLDLNHLLEEMMQMLEVSVSKKATLRLNLAPDIPAIEADATQIRQVVMNMVINASEAIGDTSGIITILTGRMRCDKEYFTDFWLDTDMAEGEYVTLEIADTGCGMDKDTLDRIYDPFFTTKFTGRGLGMAAVQGIIRGHKGAVKVCSEPGRGTTFRVLLPASDETVEIMNVETGKDMWRGSGAMLLVDDEEIVRVIGGEMLKALGFTVVTAKDGREALEMFRARDDFAFVLLDLTMPEMDGEQCFREMRRIRNDVKVIMTSGYSEQEISERFTGKGLAGFIQKPYTMTALKEAIRNVWEIE